MSFRTEMSRGDDGRIKLKVCPIGMDGSVVSVYMKKTTALRKMKNSYGEKNGIEVHTLRFCFEGVRIGDMDTAKNLQLKEGDMIEVFPELGGNCLRTCPGNMRFTIHYWVSVMYLFVVFPGTEKWLIKCNARLVLEGRIIVSTSSSPLKVKCLSL